MEMFTSNRNFVVSPPLCCLMLAMVPFFRSMDMDILLLQFCTVALENLQETIFIKIAEQFNVFNETLLSVDLLLADCFRDGLILCRC